MTLGYVTSKAAITRATHTLQREMMLEGLDPEVHFYALHPGGVRSNMGGGELKSTLFVLVDTDRCKAGAAQDVKEKYGDIHDEAFFDQLFVDPPELCGQTCAWLATGQGKELRGLFIGEYCASYTDCED